jgi:hypothetical protein
MFGNRFSQMIKGVGSGISNVLFSDNFDRADNASSMGASWTVVAGTWGVLSNQGYCAGDQHNAIVTAPVAGLANYTVTADLKADWDAGDGHYNEFYLLVKYISDTSLIGVGIEPTRVKLYKESGTTDDLASFSGSYADDTFYTVSVVVTGANIKVKINGTQVIDFTLSGGDQTTFGSNSKTGLIHFRAGTPTSVAKVENYSVTK